MELRLGVTYAPPERLEGRLVVLRRYRWSDAEALEESLAASFEHLRGFMPWSQAPPTVESVMAWLQPAVTRFGGEEPASYAITLRDGGALAGGCGLMPRIGPGALEIGYWVDARQLRRGIATEAAGLLADCALALPGIERVELRIDAANLASQGVARRLGFRLDRTIDEKRDAPRKTGRMMVFVRTRSGGGGPSR